MTIIAALEDEDYRYLFSDSRQLGGNDIDVVKKLHKIDDTTYYAECGSSVIASCIAYWVRDLHNKNDLSNFSYLFGRFNSDIKEKLEPTGYMEGEDQGSLLILTKSGFLVVYVGKDTDEITNFYIPESYTFIGSGGDLVKGAYTAISSFDHLVNPKPTVKEKFIKALKMAAKLNCSIDDKVQMVRIKK